MTTISENMKPYDASIRWQERRKEYLKRAEESERISKLIHERNRKIYEKKYGLNNSENKI